MNNTGEAANGDDGSSGLDEKSKQIVDILQVDGRTSYTAIAKQVGLSEAAVRARIARMKEQSIIQIVAVTDPIQMGYHRQAMIGVRTKGKLSDVADQLADMAEVDYVVLTAGTFDILAEVVCVDDEALIVLVERIRSLPGVRSTELMVYLRLHKQFYSWGTL